MSRTLPLGLVALVLLNAGPSPANPQQPAGSDDAPKYVFEVRGTSSQHPNDERLWSEPFDTEAKAEARIRDLQRDYGKDGLMESTPDKPIKLKVVKKLKAAAEMATKVKEAKDAVDKAKKIVKDGVSAEERKVGDTLKEYANRVKDAYQNAVNAKKDLTSLTGNLTQKQFQSVNKLIDSFNQTRSDFSQKAGTPGGAVLSLYPQVARVTPQDLKKG